MVSYHEYVSASRGAVLSKQKCACIKSTSTSPNCSKTTRERNTVQVLRAAKFRDSDCPHKLLLPTTLRVSFAPPASWMKWRLDLANSPKEKRPHGWFVPKNASTEIFVNLFSFSCIRMPTSDYILHGWPAFCNDYFTPTGRISRFYRTRYNTHRRNNNTQKQQRVVILTMGHASLSANFTLHFDI